MYEASEAFHKAAQNGAPQKAFLLFPDRVFTNDDIDVQIGIEVTEVFNAEQDFSIGRALSSEIRFSIFNTERMLDDFEFGEFTATIGAMIYDAPTDERVVCQADLNGVNWVGARVQPYLTIGGTAAANQPSHPVTSILMYNGKAYCFGNGEVTVYSQGGQIIDEAVCNFMKRKAELHWNGCGYSWHPEDRMLEEWKNNRYRVYEFVPLGVFNAERPDVPTVIQIDFTCNDRMKKFEEDLPKSADLGITYPTTLGTLLTKLCEYYEVPMRVGSFLNMDTTVEKEPRDFENATSRKVVEWIAEAACSNARMDRDGYLIFDWFKDTDVEMDEHNYMEFMPCWFETEQIDKLYNRDTQGSSDETVGDGEVGYLIQDNPFLRKPGRKG